MAERTLATSLEEARRVESERVAVSCCLNQPQLISKLRELVPDVDMFSDAISKELFVTMSEMSELQMHIDLISLSAMNQRLQASDIVDYYRHVSEANQMAVSFSTEECLVTHAKLIVQAYMKRQMYAQLSEGKELSELVSLAQKLERQGSDQFLSPKAILAQILQTKVDQGRISYPIKLLQRATKGMRKGEIIIVAGRPSAGKSTMLQNFALSAAKQGKRVVFATAEMTGMDISLRLLSSLKKQNMFSLMDMGYVAKVQEAAKELEHYPIYYHQLSNVGQLDRVIKERHREIDVVLVDYLQLLEPAMRYKSMYERATFVINELTSLAKRYQLPMVIASQFNRNAQSVQPSMADLRESGQIEQAADVIISLWTKSDELSPGQHQKVYLDLLKNRNGYTFGNTSAKSYSIWFDKPHFSFFDMEAPESPLVAEAQRIFQGVAE